MKNKIENNLIKPFLNAKDINRRNQIAELAVDYVKQELKPKSLLYRINQPINRMHRSLSHFKKIQPRLQKYRL